MSIEILRQKSGLMFALDGLNGVIPFPCRYRTSSRSAQFVPLTEVQSGIILPDGDSYITWLPVFDDWWK